MGKVDVRALAGAKALEVVANQAVKLAEFQELHEKDKASFAFDCKRHGDFLAVYLTRGAGQAATSLGYYGLPRHEVHAINLMHVATIQPCDGTEPDLKGRCSFQATQDHRPGSWSSSDPATGVEPVYQNTGYPRNKKIRIDAPPNDKQSQNGMWMGSYQEDPLCGIHVQDCARGAVDDAIVLNGARVTLFAPAGLGQSVYDRIMQEIAGIDRD